MRVLVKILMILACLISSSLMYTATCPDNKLNIAAEPPNPKLEKDYAMCNYNGTQCYFERNKHGNHYPKHKKHTNNKNCPDKIY